MPLFYRGAAIGSYWHHYDPRHAGFTPRNPGAARGTAQVMQHISQGTTTSGFVSLTRSYAVAKDYALASPLEATRVRPAFVWELELADPLPVGLVLLDPLCEITASVPSPSAAISYQHDGPQHYLLGLIDADQRHRLREPIPQPPGTAGIAQPPKLTPELSTMVYALRDAEVLAVGTIPAHCLRNRYDVW